MTSPTSLFALEQTVEVFNGLRWVPGKITGIRLTTQGVFYEAAGAGFAVSGGPGGFRPVGKPMPGKIVAIRFPCEGVSYDVEGTRFASSVDPADSPLRPAPALRVVGHHPDPG